MQPKLRLAYIEVTDDWTDAITQASGRIAALYVYDIRLHVCCCEMTPSYEMTLAGFIAEHFVCDAMQAEMASATEVGEVCYIHCWRVDGFRRARRRPGYRDVDPFVPDRMSCTLSLPGPWPRDHDTAIAEALEMLTQGGYTTT